MRVMILSGLAASWITSSAQDRRWFRDYVEACAPMPVRDASDGVLREWPDALIRLGPGPVVARLLLPTAGDPRGLPPALAAEAIAAGAAIVLSTASAAAVAVPMSSEWLLHRVDGVVARVLPHSSVRAAARLLREAILRAEPEIAELGGAVGPAGLAGRMSLLEDELDALRFPRGATPEARALIHQAARMLAAASWGREQDLALGGASRARRSEALAAVSAAAREALEAAFGQASGSPAGAAPGAD